MGNMTQVNDKILIEISENLKNILMEIEGESLVAELLLKKYHKQEDLVDNCINYISISEQDRTRLSYLTPERISKVDRDEYWSSSRRYQIKPGGFVTKVFKNIPSKEVEKFSNLFRSHSLKPYINFKVIKGNKIADYYHIDSYESECGSLGASCMKHDNCKDYFGIYCNNSERVSMLILLNEDGNLVGRSLLWNLEEHQIMDRIYTINDELYQFYFKKWASENGYLYKSEQNWYNSLFFESIGSDKKELRIDIKLNQFEFEYYPYIDTFKFFNEKLGTLSNYHPNPGSRDIRVLCSTEGDKYDTNYLRYDNLDKVYRHSGDCVRLTYVSGIFYTSNNNTIYSETLDCFILRKDSIYVEELNDYIFNEEYSSLNDKDLIESRFNYLANRVKKSPNWLFNHIIDGNICHEEVLN
jgi:hypothetical protein